MNVPLQYWTEAQRADRVVAALTHVRAALGNEFFENISALLRGVETVSILLRDMCDLLSIYSTRIQIIVPYLNILLPSMSQSFQQMLKYLEHEAIIPKARWTSLSERLEEQGQMSNAARVNMFVEYLIQLIRLLTKYVLKVPKDMFINNQHYRSPLYDHYALESLRLSVLHLRMLQGIPGEYQRSRLCLKPLLIEIS